MPTLRSHRAPLFLLALAALGAGTSALLLHEYLFPEGGACGPGGGCDVVRQSAYASPGGVPLPAVGLAFFALFAVSLWMPRLRGRRLHAWLGGASAAAGLVFLTLQGVVIEAWCPYCVVVDLCAVGLGLAMLLPSQSESRVRVSAPLAVGVGALGLALPMAFGVLGRPAPPPADEPVPDTIAAADAEGRTTIVEFVDFQCPFCREQHARLSRILEDYGEHVEVDLRHLPLPMHPHAREAARVACCADEQGLHHEVADALMRHPELDADACRQCAADQGVDLAALDACLASDRPDARLDAFRDQAMEARVRSLPTCFIGGRRFEGLQSEAALREAIERALSGASQPT